MGVVYSHFLDSGAFTLWTQGHRFAKEHGCSRLEFFNTPAFWKYVDDYAAFIKRHQKGIDYYANVDVIRNPELTYRNQKYLEDRHGLRPVPAVHYPTPLHWLKRYIDEGYDFIGFGGLIGGQRSVGCQQWLDRAFSIVCSGRGHLPKVRVHGFAVTSFTLMLRYPWWSVDSTRWAKGGGYGYILVPHKRGSAFSFKERPYPLQISRESNANLRFGHYLSLPERSRRIVDEWLSSIGVPMGESDGEGNVLTPGVSNDHAYRRMACLLLFEEIRKTVPEWPWPFNPWVGHRDPKGFGLC